MYLDITAISIFLILWMGYPQISRFIHPKKENLQNVTHKHRIEWMHNALFREDKGFDMLNIANIIRVVLFFASTSILIVAAIIPLVSYSSKLESFIKKIPFSKTESMVVIEYKILLFALIFIYAFFKATWSLRQYNYASIMLLSTPLFKVRNKKSYYFAKRNAGIFSNASRHFSMSINSYYFGIAALTWLVNPYIFIFASTLTFAVLFRREFLSKALDIIAK
jgi:uncharacterized membrane protein